MAKIFSATLITILALNVFDFDRNPLTIFLTSLWLCLFFTDESPAILSAASILAFFGTNRALGLLNFIFFGPDLPSHWLFTNGIHSFTENSYRTIVRCGCSLTVILIGWLLLRTNRLQGNSLSISLAILFLTSLFFDFFKAHNIYIAYFLFVFLILWFKLMWSILLIAKSGLGRPRFPISQLWIFFPVWNFGVIPQWVPLRLNKLKGQFSHRADEMRLTAIYLSAAFLGLLYLGNSISFYLFARPPRGYGYPNFIYMGLTAFLESVPNAFVAWVIIFYLFAYILLFQFGAYLTVGTLLLMTAGIPAITPLNSPHLATSFHDFSSRILRFYIQLVSVVFYTPILTSLRFLRQYRKLRTFLATFLSVLILGIIYHLFRYLPEIAEAGFWETCRLYFSSQFLYIVVISALSGFSVIWHAGKTSSATPFFHGIRLALIFIAYALVLTLFYNPHSDSLTERLRLYLFLFTGQR